LLVARSECKGGVNEVAIDIVEPESPTTRLEGGFDTVRTMIVVPELRGDKHILPPNCPGLEHLLHGIADCFFIAVAFRTIEMAKSHFQCGPGCLFSREGIWN